MHDTPSRGRRRNAYCAAVIAAMAIVMAGLAGVAASRDVGDIDVMQAAAGRAWYDQYCTSCHGPGGAPGSAVYATDHTAVDLRRYVARHGGRFPANEWIAVVEQVDPRNPHAAVWEEIRRTQGGTSGREAGARGIVVLIAEYVRSVQAK